MNIFDILGPVMVGPSGSRTVEAVRTRLLTRKLLGNEPVRMVATLSSSLVTAGTGYDTDRALVAGLLGTTPDDIRIPGNFELAKKEGLDFRFLDNSTRDARSNTAYPDVMGTSGWMLEVWTSSLSGGRIMLNRLDGTRIDVTVGRLALIVHSIDKPGLVAIMTSLLAKEPINIITVSLYYSKRDGDAVMATEMDQSIPKALVEDLKKVGGILKVTCLNIQAGTMAW